ncbi:MAG: TIGR04282 family arsenosugar biosynthesis glycosyltransferase [Myxococcales bacterium]|nr:TIGR04282 family arsenosugar biosynthesis glycosyltransferase [Myxococcales bacterium]
MGALNQVQIFAKAPVPGEVKRRLQPPLSAVEAAALHEAFVRDVVARELRPGRAVTVWRAGDPHHGLWRDLRALGVPVVAQDGVDLGRRMAHALHTGLHAGEKVVLIGTDTPSLPAEVTERAFAALDEVPVVLGPACDGGYYLIGVRGAVPDAFTGVAWGSARVLAQTLSRLDAQAVPWALVDFWYDVDRPADLALLAHHVGQLADPPPATTAALTALGDAHHGWA